MSHINKRVPKRRFEEFNNVNAWEQRKLGDITESFSGGTPQAGNSDYYGGEIPFIRSGEINDEQTELFITDEGLNNSSAKIVEKGDILYALYGATSGEVGISQINGAINQAILAIRPTKDDNSYLIVQWLLKQKEAIIRTYLQGGQGNLSSSIVKELTLMLPKDKTEQAKIGVFFKQLDNTITLHQRKLEKIKALKAAYLSEMFPAEGETKPKRRFAGFTDDWEQGKLEELAAFSKGSGYTKNDLVEKGMPLVLYGRLYTKYETIITEVNTFTKMKDKSVISKGNEVVVPSSGETAKDISRASVIGAEGFILGGDLNIIKPKRELNSIFLALTISNGEQQKEIIKRAQGKSVVHVYNTDLKQVKLSYPTFNEQEKIGSFFRQLDNAIALHQRKLQKLQNIKKAYLNEMFI
ncbi:restriction endonuclease subunit S [Listeria monocytogenes]|uniref:restriction endonuclease subunit S n=1 Tax=Listeria monocytogenes TaxID=1639 RepID=UPI0010B96E56|nr:restriction endonuclease subunit S [Listeria monocytogenes]EAF4502030.1 restriction endonuclease subunit S [Listeria monocytogenes serotype 4b]EAF4548389.1 restriction endonuclease subunit S [Listeria monocytogenes serotype 1/2a]EAD5531644.1 restriction endonuclease subunit S [Listeria monocytogenes]EAD8566626.1 restriction endonuclease subunit S [Listeria monocytogenes]EAE1669178.1 restriction endonuclease subunit S [Listeria monocytogenes]